VRFHITEGIPTLVRLTRIAAKPAIERREPEVLLSCMLHAPPHVRPHTTTSGASGTHPVPHCSLCKWYLRVRGAYWPRIYQRLALGVLV